MQSRLFTWDFALVLGLLVLWVFRPFGVDAPHFLNTEFNTDRAISRLETILQGERPHPSGSDENDAVRARLLVEITKAGFAPIVRDQFHCNTIREGAAICAQPRNVLFWVTPPGDDAVMLTAHYDSVPAGPGVADDGMGVAVALEVATLLKRQKLQRPVLVLLTDAEEAGLVGASAFAAHDPVAKRIGAVVNLEARGTTGAAAMFQTSSPNGHDVAALQKGGRVQPANTLATDLYDRLPNDTDLTMLLPLGVDAANYAFVGGGKRYHTSLDNLAHLDRQSVRQLGASALAAVTGFANSKAEGTEGRKVFANLEGWLFLVLPQGVAAVFLGLGLVGAMVVFIRTGGGQAVRTTIAPLLALAAGVGLAVGLGFLIDVIRPEAAFGTAYPIALRLVYAASALLGAVGIIHALRIENRRRLAASAWVWLSAAIAAAFMFMPGLSTLIVWSSIFLLWAGVVSFLPPLRRSVPWLLVAAAILFALIALPMAGGLEDALFVEYAAPISLLLVFILLFFMPRSGPHSGLLLWILGAVSLAGFAAAALLPAYSIDAPRHLNIIHEDIDGKAVFRVADNGPLPAAMKAAAAFANAPDKERGWLAPASAVSDDGEFAILSNTVADGVRTISLRVQSPWADRQELRVTNGEGVRGLTVNGVDAGVRGPLSYVGCTGRACRNLDITLTLAANAALPEISWQRVRYGAGEAASGLVAARPDTAQPVHSGDQQSLIRSVKLG